MVNTTFLKVAFNSKQFSNINWNIPQKYAMLYTTGNQIPVGYTNREVNSIMVQTTKLQVLLHYA